MLRTTAIAAAVALVAGSLSAQAQELSFSYGGTITSNYMSRGVTQSNNRPALQFYSEIETSGFYAGAWASTVRLAPDSVEVDLYAGYRFSVGAASFDLGYARYFYNRTGNCCGEVYASFEVESGSSTFSGGLAYDPGARVLADVNLGVSYDFGNQVSASAMAGRTPGGGRYGVVGVGYEISDNFGVEAAYHLTNAQRNQLVVSLNFNF
jgi:uncharacterized protein (TIGR02001 family)